MKQFICISTFTTAKAVQYVKGDKIYESEFYRLSPSDKIHFSQVQSDLEEFESPKSKDPIFEDDQQDKQYSSGNLLEELFEDVGSHQDDPPADNSSLDDDFEFGGGDGGGAGASDDF